MHFPSFSVNKLIDWTCVVFFAKNLVFHKLVLHVTTSKLSPVGMLLAGLLVSCCTLDGVPFGKIGSVTHVMLYTDRNGKNSAQYSPTFMK